MFHDKLFIPIEKLRGTNLQGKEQIPFYQMFRNMRFLGVIKCQNIMLASISYTIEI